MGSIPQVPNPGLPMTAAMNYNSTMVLYTACDPVETVVDGAPPGPHGRLFKIPVGKPTKVPYEAGRFILDHLGYTGVVRVRETENDNGISYEVEEAHDESLAKGAEQDELRFRQYVSDCMDDYIARKDGKSKVPPPPPETILRLIKRRGYNLKDYGIVPLGYENPLDNRQKQLESENATLKAQLSALSNKFDLVLQQTGFGRPAPAPDPTPNPPTTADSASLAASADDNAELDNENEAVVDQESEQEQEIDDQSAPRPRPRRRR